MRDAIKHALLRGAGIHRLHIVGCARSGTSMLHYAHAAFRNTLFIDDEVSLWNRPGLREAGQLVRQRFTHARQHARWHLITKRGEFWYRPEAVARTARYVRRYRIFLLLIVRNPLDVITSHHSMIARRFFVDPDVWHQSVDAGEALMDQLVDYPHVLTLRYEDIVRAPVETQTRLMKTAGLALAPGVDSWAHLRSNVDERGPELGAMIPFMHRLRDFDTESVDRWQADPENRAFVLDTLARSAVRDRVERFMRDHGYIIPPFDEKVSGEDPINESLHAD